MIVLNNVPYAGRQNLLEGYHLFDFNKKKNNIIKSIFVYVALNFRWNLVRFIFDGTNNPTKFLKTEYFLEVTKYNENARNGYACDDTYIASTASLSIRSACISILFSIHSIPGTIVVVVVSFHRSSRSSNVVSVFFKLSFAHLPSCSHILDFSVLLFLSHRMHTLYTV